MTLVLLPSITITQVDCVEILPDRHEIAIELTERCNLSPLVKYHCGDVTHLTDVLGNGYENTFNHFVSYLVFLHIKGKKERINLSKRSRYN